MAGCCVPQPAPAPMESSTHMNPASVQRLHFPDRQRDAMRFIGCPLSCRNNFLSWCTVGVGRSRKIDAFDECQPGLRQERQSSSFRGSAGPGFVRRLRRGTRLARMNRRCDSGRRRPASSRSGTTPRQERHPYVTMGIPLPHLLLAFPRLEGQPVRLWRKPSG